MNESIPSNSISIESQVLHAPYPLGDVYGSLNMPVYQTVAYEFSTARQMELAFTGQTSAHVYSRISNPSVQYFENRVKLLSGATEVIAFNSGMAAIINTLMTIGYAGGNIVTSPHLFGNTYSLLSSTLRDFGLEPRFCDLTDSAAIESMIDENTCALFLEVITNPQLEVIDLQKLSQICKSHHIPLIADTTIIPFPIFLAKNFGIDIEVVSSTKYISGGATSLGGLVLDYQSFDWSHSPKLSTISSTSEISAFTTKMRREIHRNLGAYMSPQSAYFQTIGLESLSLRYRQAASTCHELACCLCETTPTVSVNYPGLPDHPHHAISVLQFGEYPGAMLTFDLSSRESCFRFIDNLKLIRRATNLFDNKTLALHPASTIFGSFTEEVRQSMDISQRTIRLSIGLENVEDLYKDILQALQG